MNSDMYGGMYDDACKGPSTGVETNCDDLVRALYEYVDGAGDPEARANLKKHAEECPSCLQALGVEQQVRDILKSCCSEPAPMELKSKIIRRLRITTVEYRSR